MKTKILALFCALFAFGLTACNTTAGVGRDIEATGDAIEDAAESAKDKMTDNE